MLIFAASDKGGTGRSVTSCNIAYHLSMQRNDVAYLDFDFGSPTTGAIFEISKVERGTEQNGLHSYVEGKTNTPHQVDVLANSDRAGLRAPAQSGRLVLLPGDKGGAEFTNKPEKVQRCVNLFRRLDQEFDICMVDLSAGRSHALDMVLRATAQPELALVPKRWLVFHRWTRQHIMAANGLVYGDHGILGMGRAVGHDPAELEYSLRFVRTAVPSLKSPRTTDRAAQAKWLRTFDEELRTLAARSKLGRSMTLGDTPMEPVLQWREQIISASDVSSNIANAETLAAFQELAGKLVDDVVWERL
ncbi:SCO2523 family variant P-loop protein [Actinokineospora soli]